MSRTGSQPPQMSRRRAVVWGMALGYLGLLLTITRNILLVPLYLHFMSLAEYGAWLATGAVAVQWLITDFGLAGVLMQRCAALHGAGDARRLAVLISSGLAAGLALAIVLALAAVIVIPFLPPLHGLTATEGGEVTLCIYVAVAAAALGILGAVSQGMVRSLQHAAAAGSITLAAELAGVITTVSGLLLHSGLLSLAAGLLVRSAVLVVAQTGYLLLRACRGLSVLRPPAGKVVRELFADGWVSFLSSLAMKTPTQANTLFIGYTLGSSSAAMYGLTVRAHDAALLFIGQVNGALAPSLAHLWGSGDEQRFRVLVNRIAMVGALAGGASMAVLICANAGFVGHWLRDSAFAGQRVSILMAAMVCVSATGSVAYDALYALGRFRTIAMTFIGAALVHVLLLTTALHLGIWVAAGSSLVSTALWSLVFWWKLQELSRMPRRQVRRTTLDFLLAAASGAAVATLLLQWIPARLGWTGLALTALGAALAASGVTLLVAPWIRSAILTEVRETRMTLMSRHGVARP